MQKSNETSNKPEEKRDPSKEEIDQMFKRAEEKRESALRSFYHNTARIYGDRARSR